MGTRIRATLYLLFGLWWVSGIAITAIEMLRDIPVDIKTALGVFLGSIILMLPGFICIDLGLKKLRWLRSKRESKP